MYSKITINNTERKEIGNNLLKKSDEIIHELNNDYERYYKINKLGIQREKEFQEFLKKQEQHQFYLKSLVKIIRIYFKENNYNSDTYYFIGKSSKYLRNKKNRMKKTKSLKIIKDKLIFHKLLNELSQTYKLYKPWVAPLTLKDKKILNNQRSNTESKLLYKNNKVKIGQSIMKLYLDIFGVIPVNSIKKENKKKNDKDRKKSSINTFRNYYHDTKTFDNKTLLVLKKGMILKEKYFGAFDKMKKYIYMKKRNPINLKTKVITRNFNDLNNNRFFTTKKIIRNNIIFNNKSSNYYPYPTFSPKEKEYIKNKKIENNRYSSYKHYHLVNKNCIKPNNNSHNYNLSTMKNRSSFDINKCKTPKNEFNNNFSPTDSKRNTNNNFRKYIGPDYLSKFKNEFSKTLKKVNIFNHDISFSNKIFSLSKKNITHAKKLLEDNQVKPVSMLNIIKKDIYEQKMKALEKFKYIKENMKGDLKINLIKFVRKPPNKLNNIRDYTRQREQFKKYQDFDPVDHSDDEEEKDYLNIYPDFVKKNKMLLNQKNRISNLILKINKKPL